MIRLQVSVTANIIWKSQRSILMAVRVRNFAVKEVSWCSNSNFKSKQSNTLANINTNAVSLYLPIERFGIIAAMSNNSIIGVKGILPWNNPDDRAEFLRVTSGKVLVIGRKTFEEQPTRSHISHAAKCIVISKSLDFESILPSVSAIKTEVLIASSFREALDLARRVTKPKDNDDKNDTSNDIDCWIAGGEGIYRMAILHPSAYVIHLTVINIDVDVSSNPPSEVARFPPKYHWDHRFTKRSETDYRYITQDDKAIKFTKYLYSKKSVPWFHILRCL